MFDCDMWHKLKKCVKKRKFQINLSYFSKRYYQYPNFKQQKREPKINLIPFFKISAVNLCFYKTRGKNKDDSRFAKSVIQLKFNPKAISYFKGGNPAAGSPTATLLRLNPSHSSYRVDLPPCG